MDGKWQNLIVEKRKRGKEVKRQRVEPLPGSYKQTVSGILLP